MKRDNTERIHGPNGLCIILDPDQRYEGGTPVMVYRNRGLRDEDCGTFNCAVGEGELSHLGTRLTRDELDWLESEADECEQWMQDNPPIGGSL